MRSTRLLKLNPKTAIKISNRIVERKFIIAKILFLAKQIQKSQGISNLRLAARKARGNPQNQWAALCAAHEIAGQKSESQILERDTGGEPVSTPWKGVIEPLN